MSTGPAEQPETIETDPHVELLLAPFDDDQQYLVDQVALLYAQSGKWPVFEYIEQLLAKRRLDSLVVLASFPWIKSARAHPVWEYWPVFYGRFVSPSPESTVQLTVLGLAKATLQLDTVGSFLKVLSILADARATWPLDPYSVTKPLLPVNSLWTGTIPPVVPERVLALLPREPATAETPRVETDQGSCFQLSGTLLRYRGVDDLNDYIRRVVDQVAPAPAAGVPSAVSPYSLPAAIDYLSIVWLEKYGRRLAQAPSFEMAAKLAQLPGSSDEFNSRLSGLAETSSSSIPERRQGSTAILLSG